MADTSPVKAPYPFPGLVTPYKHQIETGAFYIKNKRGFNFNDIGTGKTLATVWATDYLMNYVGYFSHTLVIAPLSTLDMVWFRSFYSVNRTLKVYVLKGTKTKRLKLLNEAAKQPNAVVVINPDALHLIAGEKALEKFKHCVIDECTAFKNPTSRRYKALKKINTWLEWLWAMSGSPMPEAPTDVWAMARLICPENIPSSFTAFRDMTMIKKSTYTWISRPDAIQLVGKMLAGKVIRYTREECIDIPPTQTATLEIEPTKEQARLLAEIRKEAWAEVEKGAITGSNEAVIISKMLQICAGAVKATAEDGTSVLQKVDCQPMFDALKEITEATDNPVIVYAPFIGTIARLIEWANENKITHRVVIGDTSPANRVAAFDGLQNGEIKLLIAHPKAMAHGITLTRSNVIVWFSPMHSQEITEQANGRIVRPGQVNRTYIIYLTCSAIQRRVVKKNEGKDERQSVLLDYLKENQT